MNNIELKLINNIKKAVSNSFNLEMPDEMFMIELPKDPSFGDYSTNIAMRLTKILKQNPRLIAEKIVAELNILCDNTEAIEIANPGFINFRLKKTAISDVINQIILLGDKYGQNNSGNGQKILVEYVSANPTGDLHLGHARGAAWGDAVTRLLNFSGYNCLREYYINDAGRQIEMLGLSLIARYEEAFGLPFELPEDGYHGRDVIDIAHAIKDYDGDKWLKIKGKERLAYFKAEGIRLELEKIKKDLAYYRVSFDSWVSEQSLYDNNRVIPVLNKLKEMNVAYEKDGALWFKTTDYGDDKDRVLIKSDGSYTYLTPDIANHMYKFERGYDKLVDLWGADHHGYIKRMCAALEALGHPQGSLEVDIIQMVRLVENGEEVKMSKRTGNAVTIRELCDDVGVDAARYFFVARAVDTHLDFDLGLARSQSNDNPVYYAQYAYARICSILNSVPAFTPVKSYELLVDEKEIALLRLIAEFPKVVSEAALLRQPNKVCNYIQKLAQLFHSFYGSNKVNDPSNLELTNQRVGLLIATKITMKNALNLIAIEALEKM